MKIYEKKIVCFENFKYYIFGEKIYFIVFEIGNIIYCNLKLKLVVLKNIWWFGLRCVNVKDSILFNIFCWLMFIIYLK